VLQVSPFNAAHLRDVPQTPDSHWKALSAVHAVPLTALAIQTGFASDAFFLSQYASATQLLTSAVAPTSHSESIAILVVQSAGSVAVAPALQYVSATHATLPSTLHSLPKSATHLLSTQAPSALQGIGVVVSLLQASPFFAAHLNEVPEATQIPLTHSLPLSAALHASPLSFFAIHVSFVAELSALPQYAESTQSLVLSVVLSVQSSETLAAHVPVSCPVALLH
jgi:hypothetical protein